MQSIRQVARLNDIELQKCVPPNASWHTDYRDTAYIYIGGLPFELSEGDVLTIFSQYGNPVHINLVRDKETGKSKGFCFLKYEDQRSCDLAVDNLSGAQVLGRMLSVDHTRYKMKEGEVETVGEDGEGSEEQDDTDREGEERRKRRRTSESDSEQDRPVIKEEVELARLKREMDDEDPMKAYLVKEKQSEVENALRALTKRKEHKERRHRPRHHSEREIDAEYKLDGHRPHRTKKDDDSVSRRHRSPQNLSRHTDDRSHHSHKPRRDSSATPDLTEQDTHKRRQREVEGMSDAGDRDDRRRRQRPAYNNDRSRSREKYKYR
ncbi:MAG: hypothetical protein FE78DRAFT_142055 [Acidomyces sp. 'richmondensis']|nr:MAG: hypothetical protein FE78DRAFT_142055 [Acidomyces sp. 'richmondensis']